MNDSLLVRLPKGEDLLSALVAICLEKNITKGHVSLIGALEKAELGYYPQDTRKYVTHTLNEGTEILAGGSRRLGGFAERTKPEVHCTRLMSS